MYLTHSMLVKRGACKWRYRLFGPYSYMRSF